MPILIFARHAHASHEPGPDYDRPLTGEGRDEARRAGDFLADLPIDSAIASSARRTAETAQLIIEQLNAEPELRLDDALYQAQVLDWREAVATIPAESQAAIIVGHNPTVADAVAEFSGRPVEKFRPSSIAVFEFDSWDDAAGILPQPQIRDFVQRA